MRNRKEEIKKRIAMRKRQSRLQTTTESTETNMKAPLYESYYDQNDLEIPRKLDGKASNGGHPLFNKEAFLFKILASACLFLIVGIIFQNHSPIFQKAQTTVKNVMEHEFQFAAVSQWYENTFGQPLALFPDFPDNKTEQKPVLALPANAKILENFDITSQGITIETFSGANVEAMDKGKIIFAGIHENLGNLVKIQHADNSETWYGHLGMIHVSLYEEVGAGEMIGTVSTSEQGSKGEFYFAIKKDESFIDPIQVINFE